MTEQLLRDEIGKMSTDQLLDKLEDLLEQHRQMRFDRVIGQLENTNLLRVNRRNIARLKTILRQREIASQAAAEEGKK